MDTSVFLATVALARVQVNLLVNPVLHGWVKTLRIINYFLALPKKLKHRFHLNPDKKCSICQTGDYPWNPTENEKVAEKCLFRYETRVIKEFLNRNRYRNTMRLRIFSFIKEELSLKIS